MFQSMATVLRSELRSASALPHSDFAAHCHVARVCAKRCQAGSSRQKQKNTNAIESGYEYLGAVIGQIACLLAKEAAGLPGCRGLFEPEAVHDQLFEAETAQVRPVNSGRHEYLAIIAKAYEATIEQKICIRRQHKAVHAIQALMYGPANSPGLYVARNEKGWVRDTCQTARRLDCRNTGSKHSLASTSQDHAFLRCVPKVCISADMTLDSVVKDLRYDLKVEAIRTSA